MKSFLILGAALTLFTGAQAAPVSFGAVVLTDNAGGLFVDTAVTSAAGNLYTIDLRDFVQSNFDPNPGHIDFSLNASSAIADIIGVRLTYFGSFTGLGSASYSQTIGALPASMGSFDTPSFTEGTVSFGAFASTDISGFIDLADGGDLAQVTSITIEVFQERGNTVPEPQTYALAGLALAAMAGRRKRRA